MCDDDLDDYCFVDDEDYGIEDVFGIDCWWVGVGGEVVVIGV